MATSRLAVLLCASLLLLAGCDRGAASTERTRPPPTSPDPGVESDCDDLADSYLDLLQATLDEVATLSEAELLAGDTPRLQELAGIEADLDAAVAEAGCDRDELRGAVVEGAAELRSAGGAADLLLEMILEPAQSGD